MTTKTLKERLDEVEKRAVRARERHVENYIAPDFIITEENELAKEQLRLISALRAFDEMHEYWDSGTECTCGSSYPCPTRVKVETAVGL